MERIIKSENGVELAEHISDTEHPNQGKIDAFMAKVEVNAAQGFETAIGQDLTAIRYKTKPIEKREPGSKEGVVVAR